MTHALGLIWYFFLSPSLENCRSYPFSKTSEISQQCLLVWVFFKIHFIGYSLSSFNVKTHVLENIFRIIDLNVTLDFLCSFLSEISLHWCCIFMFSYSFYYLIIILFSPIFHFFLFYSLGNFLSFIFQTLLSYIYPLPYFLFLRALFVVGCSSFLKKSLLLFSNLVSCVHYLYVPGDINEFVFLFLAFA